MYNYGALKEIQKIFGQLNYSDTELKENFVNEKFSWFARKPTDKEKDYTITGFSFNTWSNLSQISYMDYLMYDDIVKATYADPFLPPKHNYELGFPNILEARFGWLQTAFEQSKKNALETIQQSDLLSQGLQ